MHRKSLLVVIGFLTACTYAWGQGRVDRWRAFNNGPYLAGTYTIGNFLNRGYEQRVSAQQISTRGGFDARFQYIAMPMLFEAGYFHANYSTTLLPGPTYERDEPVRHRGFEIATSLIVAPDIPWLLPYAGVGWHGGSLQVGDSEEEDETGFASAAVQGPLFKVGGILKFAPAIGAQFEYRRTLSLNEAWGGYYLISAGLTMRMRGFARAVEQASSTN